MGLDTIGLEDYLIPGNSAFVFVTFLGWKTLKT